MSLMGGTDLGVTVDANVSPYERNIDRAKRATVSYEKQLEQLDADVRRLEKSLADEAEKSMQRRNDALNKGGRAMFVFGAAVEAGFALATREAVKWESAFTGVTKTTNGNAEQMAQLEDDLRSLARTLPSTHQEIAATAEAAGQLGVKRDDIAAFTKVMLDLGQTTNLSAEEAATSIAQLMNAMDSDADVVDRIGNTLVDLGNKGASTEADILAMAKRIAGAGHLIGASESDVLAIASALSNLGIQAELGGGATQRVLLMIYTAMKEGGDQAERFADLAGMSSERFAKAWEQNPVRAFNLLVKGMGRVQDEGGNLVQRLDDVGIKGTQNLQVMLRLAGAGDELSDSLSISTRAWEKNNALVKEAEKRYETTESKIAVARNQIVDAAIDIGGVVLPVLAQVVSTGADLLRTWDDLPGPVKSAITVIGILTGVIALSGGAALIAVPKIAAFKAAVEALDAGKTKTAGKSLIGLAGFLTGPWGAAIGVGITALGIFAAKHGEAAQAVDALKATLDEQTGAITDNSREWAIKKLSDEGALDAARRLGLDLGMVTEAALGNADAASQLQSQLDALQSTMGNTGPDRVRFKALGDLQRILGDTNGTLDKAREKWELENEAKAGSAGASDKAADSASKLPPILDDVADSAGDAAEEVQALGDELSDLAETFFSNRDAGRAVRDTMREIRKSIREYIKDNGDLDGAFKNGTKSGDEFAGLLDQLAQNYLDQITSVEELYGSQKRTMRAYREARDELYKTARQLGLSKKAAQEYVDTVLGTPAEARTHFIQQGLDQAQADLEAYAAYFGNIPEEVITRFYTIHEDRLDRAGGSGGPNQGIVPPHHKPPNGTHHGGANRTIWGAANSRPRSFASGGGSPSGSLVVSHDIDYDRLAGALAEMRPLWGSATFNSSGDYERAKRDSSRMAGAGGRGTGRRSGG